MKNTRSSEPYQFSNIRSQNKNEILEDYVEAIQEILNNKGDVKNADLAQHFGVSQATVNKNLKRLISFNLAKSEPYRSIFLTEKGEKLATQSKQKHEIVYNFLIKLGVSRKTAENDSEGIEHHVSDETLKLMKKFKSFVEDENLKDFEEDLIGEAPPNTADAMKRYKAGKAGFTDKAHLKAKGLIPRADGTKRKSDKYK